MGGVAQKGGGAGAGQGNGDVVRVCVFWVGGKCRIAGKTFSQRE